MNLFTPTTANDFNHALYPGQGWRALVAVLVLLAVHFIVGVLLWRDQEKLPAPQKKEELLVLLNLQADKQVPQHIQPTLPSPPKKPTNKRIVKKPSQPKRAKNKALVSPANDIMSQITAAQEKRAAEQTKLLEEATSPPSPPSEDDIAIARIKASIKAATYSRYGVNGIFQVLDKGVQVGRFSFRGWMNNPDESTWQTYEVDAGVGGNVELALVQRMIQLIRSHYSGDFNWESQRLGRTVVLSARPKDNAQLEKFLMNEFFGPQPR